MTYRVSLRSNPRLNLLLVVVGLVSLTAIVVFAAFGVLAGVVALAVAVYIDYQLIKFLKLQLASLVDVSEDGLHCITSAGETLDFPWDSVTHAGVCMSRRHHKTIFLYDEPEDKLVTIPHSFGSIDNLETEISSHIQLAQYTLVADETVRDRIRSLISDQDDGKEDDD